MDRQWLRLPRRRRRAAVLVAAAVAAGLGLTQLPVLHHADASRAGDTPADTAKPLDETTAVHKARATGRPVEVTALRDANSTTYARPDGSFQLETHAVPFRAKVGGVWRAIDTDLHRTKDGGWAPEAVNNSVVFSAGSRGERATRSGNRTAIRPAALTTVQDAASTDLVTFTTGGHRLTLTWPGTLPAPVIDGARALYQEVLPGVDLLLTARDSGFSHVLIVKNAEAAADPELAALSYGLTSPDLTFTLDPVTHVVHAEDADGDEVAASPTPYMWDSAGKPAVTQGGDPQPSRPSEAPAPEAGPDVDPSEEPEDVGGTPDQPDWSDDTAAPQEDEPSPAAYRTGGTAPLARPATFTSTGEDSASVLALDGLAGPQPGTHDALAGITLTDGGALTVKPDPRLLTADSTVYPVFIDPSFSGPTNNWTTAYQPHPGSSFWNGTNFNDGTDTARVGYESTTAGLSRSFFQLALSSALKGAHVSSAYFYGLETYSWSCSPRSVQLWHTSSISSSTTWNNQPSWIDQIDAQTVANGYNSGCADDWVKFTATSLGQDAADNGWGYVTLGLQAADESHPDPWKKFEASSSNSPYLKITYNRKPKEPTHLAMSPGPNCDVSGESSVGKSDLTFAATASDPDGDLKYLDFEVWQDGSSSKILDGNQTVDANGHASVTATAGKFANGKTYWWRVRAIDSTGAASTYAPAGSDNCGFVYDTTKPNSPKVTSTQFPEDDGTGALWSTVAYGTAGAFTLGANGSTDTVRYEFSFDSTSYGGSSSPSASGGTVTVSLKPHHAGPNVFYVRAVDSAGNPSAPTKYLFYVTPRDDADGPGDLTGDAWPDVIVVDQYKDLRVYPASSVGDIYSYNRAAYDQDGLIETDSAYPDDYWTGALLTHNGDFMPGDGLQDMVARMPDGKLYLYPGDGYGSFDVTKRTEILLPQGAPDPAALDQILAAGDIDGDGRPDLLATEGNHYWAFLGYTGGAFTSAVLQNGGTVWPDRDLVSVGDHNNDGAVDLVLRTLSTGQLTLRYGKPKSGGGTALDSLATAGNSLNGKDTTYAASGWTTAGVRLLLGTPDANHDGIPDMWAVMNDGSVRMYSGGTSAVGSYTTVVSSGWGGKLAIG
ncbi:FG-GAP-like repeat-containing protein [Streptomyces sp. NPDC048179]|uniref:FG-GAP-like repeat-containing protein n=1 Tax=Streptomyces sp. NPDC048179 TaxID=3365506 RepID=UPI003717B34E